TRASPGRAAEVGEVPDAFARLRSVHRRNPLRCRYPPQDCRGDDFLPPFRTRKPRHRSRRRGLHGIEEAGGLFLMLSSALVNPVKVEINEAFDALLPQDCEKELLRFTTAGSVDDVK